MAGYIKREDAIEALQLWDRENHIVGRIINSIPSADVAEVCRCENCILFEPFKPPRLGNWGRCNYFDSDVRQSDYCSNAVRSATIILEAEETE